MEFSEKLDFLMKLTNTSNSALAQHVRLDASHISRLRRGKRNALKDEACILSMATYFCSRCTAEYQTKALAETIDFGHESMVEAQRIKLVALWLSNDSKKESNRVETFLSSFSNPAPKPRIQASRELLSPSTDVPSDAAAVYYGVKGKQEAVIYFLSEVLLQHKPRTLLLFSDEPTDWMTADRDFTLKWASLMTEVLAKGNRIKIIHTVSRDLDEMLSAISQWMPLYMSGLIEPYYYPKKKDGIYRRTLFIAPEVSAVVSSSIGTMHDQAANLLFRDEEAIAAFALEFHQYLSLCRPLMRIFTPRDKMAYFYTLLEFEEEKSDSIMKTESLSLLTMPESVLSTIASRIGKEYQHFSPYQSSRMKAFEENLKTNTYTEIVTIFDPETVLQNEVKVSFSDMLIGSTTYYTAMEYILHLEQISTFLDRYPNFHVYLNKRELEHRYMVYAKEDVGTIVAKTSVPPIILTINEGNLSATFWDYLKHSISEKQDLSISKKDMSKKLNDYILQLKQRLQ